MPRETLPLRVTQDGYGVPKVLLDGKDITTFIAADGLTIDYATDRHVGLSLPTVTLSFGPGALSLDFDVALLERLVDEAKAAG